MTQRLILALFVTFFVGGPLSAALTITGNFQRTYQAQNCGQQSGCTCSTQTLTGPVRHATVEIVNTSNVRLATTSTSATGAFSVSVSALSTGSAFRVNLWAETAAAVVYPSGSNVIAGVQYAYSAGASPNVGTITINGTVDATVPNIRPALHVMDNAIKGYQYAANHGLSMSQAVIAINAPGTDYNSNGNLIRIGAAHLWNDAMLHEYGHFMDDSFSIFRGVAYIGSQQHTVCQQFDSAPEGVFSEGWGNYVVSAVTGRTYFTGFWCSVETGGCTEKSRNIEGNVAAVLWDLHDAANETFDVIANEHQKVWNVMDGFNFTNPNLETFMADYGDTRANPIECRYTGHKCETTKPVVSSFNVTPTVISAGNSISVSWTVSDSGGSGLSRVELWRTPDSGGSPSAGLWAQVKFTTVSGNGPTSGSFSDTPPQGTFWYGIHVSDQAGNLGVESSPIKVTVGAQPCSYSRSPSSRSVSASAGSGTIQVTGSPAGCTGNWSSFVGSGGNFLSLTGASSGSGSGNWNVPYSYAQNTQFSSRQGTIAFSGSFASATFTLTQEAALVPQCSFTINPQTATGTGRGGTGSIQVSGTPANCTGSWSASSQAFLALTGTASGSGPGTWQVPYSYSQNPSTTSTRQGQVIFSGSFPGGGTFSLTQQPMSPNACAYSFSPASAIGAGSGGTGSVQVTGLPAGCSGTWSATNIGTFVSLTGTSSGSGSGTWQVAYSYSQNPSTSNSRQGFITFTGAFPSVDTFALHQQPATVTACSFAINPHNANGAGSGGTGSVQVTGSPSGCGGSWNASSLAGFLTLTGTTSGSGAGSWQIPFSYSQNPSTSSTRQGSIAFTGSFPGGSTFILTQQPATASALPNLTPLRLSNSSDKVVVSKRPGTPVDDVLRPGDPLYFDWAVINSGTGAAQPVFYIDLVIDGGTVASWRIDSALDPNWYLYLDDWLGNALAPGRHTVRIIADSTNAVAESDETDNEHTRSIVIGPGVAGDMDSDGKSDIVWRNRYTGVTLIWSLPAEGLLRTLSPYPRTAGTDYQLVGTGELGGTFPSTDLLWRRTSTRQLSTQYLAGGVPQSETVWPLTPSPELSVVAAADFDGDGLAEAVMRNALTGETAQWKHVASGVQRLSIHPGGNLNWNIVAVRDFDGDTRADILWRDSANGMTLIWFMSGTSIRSSQVVHQGGNTGWTIAGIGDFDGDSKSDVFWRQPSTGMTILWQMNGGVIRSSSLVHPGGNQTWTIAGIGDFGGDGRSDVLWRQTSTGQTLYWQMNGASIGKSVPVNPGGNLDWEIVSPVK